MTRSPTNWVAILTATSAAVQLTVTAVGLMLDSDPTTNPDWNVVVNSCVSALTQIAMAVGFWKAADAKPSK